MRVFTHFIFKGYAAYMRKHFKDTYHCWFIVDLKGRLVFSLAFIMHFDEHADPAGDVKILLNFGDGAVNFAMSHFTKCFILLRQFISVCSQYYTHPYQGTVTWLRQNNHIKIQKKNNTVLYKLHTKIIGLTVEICLFYDATSFFMGTQWSNI